MRTTLFLLLLSCTTLHSQSTWIQTGVRDTVLGIAGDGELIWIATENAGIRTFDPATGDIQNYDSTNTIINTADFRSILCSFGNVYAGTYSDGLYIYENEEWIHFDTTNSDLPGNTIRDILADKTDSSIWLATDRGLTRYKNATWTVYDSISDGIAGTHINCLYQSDDGTVWIGTRYNGITRWYDGIAENYNYLNSGINDNFIRDITQDATDLLYVANNVGINTYDPATDYWLFVYTLYTAPLSSDKINQMGFDAAQTFWIATHHGVTRADSANVWTQFYDTNSALPHNTADGLYIDQNGRVYVGTYGGLAFYDDPTPLSEPPLTLQIYPNPATDIVYIKTQQPYDIQTEVFIIDMQGRIISQDELSPVVYGDCLYAMPISNLATGCYQIIMQQNDLTISGKFIKM